MCVRAMRCAVFTCIKTESGSNRSWYARIRAIHFHSYVLNKNFLFIIFRRKITHSSTAAVATWFSFAFVLIKAIASQDMLLLKNFQPGFAIYPVHGKRKHSTISIIHQTTQCKWHGATEALFPFHSIPFFFSFLLKEENHCVHTVQLRCFTEFVTEGIKRCVCTWMKKDHFLVEI